MNGGTYRSEDGGAVKHKISGVCSFRDLFLPDLNSNYIKYIKKRMGTNTATDNYKKNKKKNKPKPIKG